jgi:aryl-alcohol dehydrogenase-like predicted oxidoreductase
LRLEQIPVYQFHRPDPNVPFEESVGTLVELKDEGKIRHIGLSNVSERHLRQAQGLTAIVSIQNRYNLADRKADGVVDLCEQERIVFFPWAPVQDLDRNRAVRQIADAHGVTPIQVAVAWLLARSPAIVPIPGTGSVAHLDENVAAAGVQLTADEVATLSRGRKWRR